MAKGFNKVILMGNLTRDPELRTTPNGQNVCSFSLAINRTWKDANGQTQEAVDFIDCTAWGKAGEIISQYTQKGRPILITGRLQSRSWEQDGQKRSKVEVNVDDFNFIGSGQGGGGGMSSDDAGPAPSKPAATKKKAADDDVDIEDIDADAPIDLSDIPF